SDLAPPFPFPRPFFTGTFSSPPPPRLRFPDAPTSVSPLAVSICCLSSSFCFCSSSVFVLAGDCFDCFGCLGFDDVDACVIAFWAAMAAWGFGGVDIGLLFAYLSVGCCCFLILLCCSLFVI